MRYIFHIEALSSFLDCGEAGSHDRVRQIGHTREETSMAWVQNAYNNLK